jgi:RNA polymerase sigma factor (sigma-70 family)
MAENETVLLERFSTRADADAFAELVRRYAQMVYSASWRILRHESDAADVTQQTFFELTRAAGQISGSLAGWLHQVATRKSIDLIRRSAHRRHREQAYAGTQSQAGTRTWQDLSGHVDEALEELDAQLKRLLMDYFLAGKTSTQIARERGISQATVSRRVHQGLKQLRSILRRRGLLLSSAALSTMLLENAAQAVPKTVLTELGKMAMVGTTGKATGLGVGALAVTKAGAVKAAVSAAAVVGVVSVMVFVYNSRSSQTSPLARTLEQKRSMEPVVRAVALTVEKASNEQTVKSPISRSPQRAPLASMSERDRSIGSIVGGGDARAEQRCLGQAGKGSHSQSSTQEKNRPTGPVGVAGVALDQGVGAQALRGPLGQIPGADLSTPEDAVHSLMTLVASRATDRLAQCLAEGARDVRNHPYLHCLGLPMEVTAVIEQGDTAQVAYIASVHTAFSTENTTWLPGESLMVTAHLIRSGELWLVREFNAGPFEGGDDAG